MTAQMMHGAWMIKNMLVSILPHLHPVTDIWCVVFVGMEVLREEIRHSFFLSNGIALGRLSKMAVSSGSASKKTQTAKMAGAGTDPCATYWLQQGPWFLPSV